MLRFSVLILLLVTKIVSRIEEIEINSFEWRDESGKNKPTVKIVFNDETTELPLRRAPFCYLAETRQCECYILRKIENGPQGVASFVKCGDKVQGNFMNSTDYFEIVPKEGGKSGEHVVKKYEADGNSTGTSPEPSDEVQRDEPNKNQIISKYLKPLSEYGQLLANETGYITIKFVVSKTIRLFEDDIDVFLQNYVNIANQYNSKINLLIVYRGWMEALDEENTISTDVASEFVETRYLKYDNVEEYDALFLIGPGGPNTGFLSHYEYSDQGCYGNPAHVVKYFGLEAWRPIYRRIQIHVLLQSLGNGFGIPSTNKKRCGDTPNGIVWIMEGQGTETRDGTLDWANCSVEALQTKKANLACLRKEINSSRTECGNGIVEDEEECDCVWIECKKCCNGCKLTENSVCANGPCCDVSKCQLIPELAKKQCRAADDDCDIPELCNGTSSQCPPNYVVTNGYACKGTSGDRGYCFNGTCGNRGDVCEWAFLGGNNAEDKCYDFNLEDKKDFGGCGPTLQSKKTGKIEYSACNPSNKVCGKIYCTQPGIEEKTNMNYTEKSSRYFNNKVLYSGIQDKSCGYMGLHTHYRSLRIDPTFVPNGSPCGSKSMCLNQNCDALIKGCPDHCPGVPIKHPYTGKILPAFELGEEIRGGGGLPETDFPYALGILISFFLVVLIGFLIMYSKRQGKILRSSSTSSKTSSSQQIPSATSPAKKISSQKMKESTGKSQIFEEISVAA